MSLTPLTEAPSNYQGSPSETDSFTDTSIRQNVGNSNTSDTNIPLSEAMQYGKTPEQAVMEAKVKKESNAKHAARELYRNIVSGQAEIERFAQMQKKVNPAMPDANDLVQINRIAGSTVDTIAEKALVDRKGDAIGKGWLETVGGLSKEQLAELNLYRLHKHNVDRMSIQGKVSGELGQVRKQYETFLKENPEYTTRSEETIREIAQFGEPEQQIRAKTYLETSLCWPGRIKTRHRISLTLRQKAKKFCVRWMRKIRSLPNWQRKPRTSTMLLCGNGWLAADL